MIEWEVDIKGGKEVDGMVGGVEISVLRTNNYHGKKSYGWFDDDKIVIFGCGGPCNYKITPFVFEELKQVAHSVCERLNDTEE